MVTRLFVVGLVGLVVLHARAVSAAEVILDLPDPLIPDVQMTAELRVTDAPSTVVNITFPSVPGMTIDVPGEGGSMQTTITNGKATITRGIPLLVTARQLGANHIPPITVRLQDGSALQTQAIDVRVEKGNPNLTGEAYAEAAFQPATIVPGEPARLVYRIYLKRGSVESLGIEPPAAAILLGERQVSRGRTFDKDGGQWTVITLNWAMTIATPGDYRVEGQQDYQVAVGDGFFDTRVLRGRVSVAPTVLTVKPLPSEGRPEDFTGLIGPLSFTTELDRPHISTGEGVELRVVAAGRQVDLLKSPVLALPVGVQAYPKDDGKSPDRNTRIFRWDLVPSAAGEVLVPPVSIPYFDPETRVYRRAESKPVTLTVVPGRTRELTVTTAPAVLSGQTAGQSAGQSAGQAAALGQPTQPGPTGPSKPAITPAPPASVVPVFLPAPLRGDAPQPPSPRLPLLVGFAFLASGALLATVRMLLARRPAAHRGRALAQALAIGDLTAAALALASLRPSLTTSTQQVAGQALEEAIDRARFGGQGFSDPTQWMRELEMLP